MHQSHSFFMQENAQNSIHAAADSDPGGSTSSHSALMHQFTCKHCDITSATICDSCIKPSFSAEPGCDLPPTTPAMSAAEPYAYDALQDEAEPLRASNACFQRLIGHSPDTLGVSTALGKSANNHCITGMPPHSSRGNSIICRYKGAAVQRAVPEKRLDD